MSFASESRTRSSPVLPLASFVDILFLLLSFLLATSALREQETQMGVDLQPTQTGEGAVSPATQIVVTVSADDRIFLGQRELALPTLRQTFEEIVKEFPNESLVIRGDRGSSFGLAVQIMDAAKDANINDVSVATVKSVEEIR